MPSKTHGHWSGNRGTPEWNSWSHMRKRCYNPKDKSYKYYGARGITVCDRWQKFENFLIDMGLKPTSAHSLERKDNEAGYSPENCVWAFSAQQNRNKRSNLYLEFRGERRLLIDWARTFGLSYKLVHGRFTAHPDWPAEVILRDGNLPRGSTAPAWTRVNQ